MTLELATTRPKGNFFKRMARALFDNPVLLKELRMGLRERRIFVIQTIYLILLGLVTLVFLMTVAGQTSSDPAQLANAGRDFFQVQFWMQFVMVVLITPSLTCGLLSTEKERHSLEMLLASRLNAGDIVLGKLGFALCFMFLLLFSAMPLTALIFFVGGVSPGQFVLAYFHLSLAVLITAQIGLTFSAREQKTAHATNQSYGLVVIGLIGFSLFIYPFFLLLQPTQNLWEYAPQSILLLEIGYLTLLMFLKTVNHLRPSLANIKAMCRAFLLAYIANVGLVAWALGDSTLSEDDKWPWLFILSVHLFLAGFFIHTPRFIVPREAVAYKRSPISHPTFWCAFFALGLFALAAACHGSGVGAWVFTAAGLALVFLFAYTAIARCMAAIMGPKVHVPTIYYVLVATTSLIPTFFLHDGGDVYSPFTGIFLSPLIATSGLATDSPRLTGNIPVAVASVITYFVLTVTFSILSRGRIAEKPAKKTDQT